MYCPALCLEERGSTVVWTELWTDFPSGWHNDVSPLHVPIHPLQDSPPIRQSSSRQSSTRQSSTRHKTKVLRFQILILFSLKLSYFTNGCMSVYFISTKSGPGSPYNLPESRQAYTVKYIFISYILKINKISSEFVDAFDERTATNGRHFLKIPTFIFNDVTCALYTFIIRIDFHGIELEKCNSRYFLRRI